MLASRHNNSAGWSSLVARQAHNLKVAGSNPAPATKSSRMPAAYRVYVLQNPKGRHYIGFSEDVPVRIEQHNAGATPSTRRRGPWELIWQSAPIRLDAARKLERDLKRQKGGNGFYQMTGLSRF